MARNKKSAIRSVVVFLACTAVLVFVLKDYLVPSMEGWETADFSAEGILNWFLWAIDLREAP